MEEIFDIKRGIGIGKITFSEEERCRYKDESWDNIIRVYGDDLINSYKEKIGNRECIISFLPYNRNDIINHAIKCNKSLFGEPLVFSLFNLQYDRDLKFVKCKKVDNDIPCSVIFIVII